MDMDMEIKQELLEIESTNERLTRITACCRSRDSYEQRARITASPKERPQRPETQLG